MLLIAGLGNPGAQYARNRHNIGFMTVDEIHARHRFSPWTKKFQALISEGMIDGEKVLLLKPQTFMNLSGQSVGEAMRFYKLAISDLVVVYDELDLPPAKLRIKAGGSANGHNGIKSIDSHMHGLLNSKDYRRLRLGIGHPGAKELVHNYVLGDFAKVDSEWLDLLFAAISDNLSYLVKKDDNGFMNKITLAMGGKQTETKTEAPVKAVPKAQSHIRQARQTNAIAPKVPTTGPMADMLAKLFGKKGD
ncbi:aminoacyl-tRNA hydrolase [Pseudochrobactrum sp. sp1633]|uniref:aminoacyl-tRNA hydrolase n=1 Tax=Pseudochrobactrum sp. sp1633 TaxID=3036706 RepID=UPI0025A59B97|nr:aminoacyl-tRNA hydrolase [Pseudochrobactrum sp. sp1633]MDM8345530.1 aminoacyl-tRNA hydrolase [Pseudochrobactrum sp. sp1633]HWD13157.1 aminoacyl-tRNA hydrolase [Pseudochrobactrum sp.]